MMKRLIYIIFIQQTWMPWYIFIRKLKEREMNQAIVAPVISNTNSIHLSMNNMVYIQTDVCVSKGLVNCCAIATNLSFISSKNSDSAKLGNSRHKGIIESSIARCKLLNRASWSCISKQYLIRTEQAFSLYEVLVIGIVECLWRSGIHVDGDPRINFERAHLSELQGVCSVQSRIDLFSVNSLGELVTMRETKRMCTCTYKLSCHFLENIANTRIMCWHINYLDLLPLAC